MVKTTNDTYDVETVYRDLLALREGRRDTVYKDSRGFLTVGIGHLVLPEDNLSLGDTISDEQIDAFFSVDGAASMDAAREQAGEAEITDETFLPYLASVCFQLGNAWTDKWPNTWDKICNKFYLNAADSLNTTPWKRQTPVRVADFQAALRRLARGS